MPDVHVKPRSLAWLAVMRPDGPPAVRKGKWRGLYVERYSDGSCLVDAGGPSPRVRLQPPRGVVWDEVEL